MNHPKRFCPVCGHDVEGGSNYCSTCGHAFSVEKVFNLRSASSEQPDEANRRLWFFGLATIGIIMTLVGMGYLLIGTDRDSKPEGDHFKNVDGLPDYIRQRLDAGLPNWTLNRQTCVQGRSPVVSGDFDSDGRRDHAVSVRRTTEFGPQTYVIVYLFREGEIIERILSEEQWPPVEHTLYVMSKNEIYYDEGKFSECFASGRDATRCNEDAEGILQSDAVVIEPCPLPESGSSVVAYYFAGRLRQTQSILLSD